MIKFGPPLTSNRNLPSDLRDVTRSLHYAVYVCVVMAATPMTSQGGGFPKFWRCSRPKSREVSSGETENGRYNVFPSARTRVHRLNTEHSYKTEDR